MITSQKSYLEDLLAIKEAVQKINLDTTGIDNLSEEISNMELLIPVVGEFSAGKSSLLNSFIGKNVLPTGIAPETALAAELRYDTEERIEAINSEGQVIKTFAIDQFSSIGAEAESFSFLRVYLNNNAIHNIEPLVLVDMPGFESPLDAHNNAIRAYLNKGAHFITLVNVKDGTLKDTSIRHLSDIREFDRDFTVVLSKKNLATEENIEKVKVHIADQIDMNFGESKTPIAVGRDGEEAINGILSHLNPNNLFSRIALPLMKDVIYNIESTINVRIAAFNKDTSENDRVIEKLKSSLDKIKREEEYMKANAMGNLVDTNVGKIVNFVGKDLSESVDSLVTIAINGGAEALSSEISDIIHSSLVSNVKSSLVDITDNITTKFNLELKELGNEMNAYSGGDFVEEVAENAKSLLDNAVGRLRNAVEQTTKKDGKSYEMVTGLLAILTDVVNPLLEVVIVLLPEILNFFKKKNQEQQVAQAKADVRSQILTTVIPKIKRQLTGETAGVLEGHVNNLISEISQKYFSIIETKQQEIAKAEEEKRQKASEIAAQLALLTEAKSVVGAISKKIFA